MNQPSSPKGFPVAGVLGIVFVILKLCGVIDWSWWWVTCPFWGFAALFFAVLLGGVALAALLTIVIGLGVAIRKIFSN